MTQENINQVADIVKRFDFNKVHDYMQKTGWKWRDEVPQIEEIKMTATRLLLEAVESSDEFLSSGTGGFRVYKFPWGLELVFALTRKGNF